MTTPEHGRREAYAKVFRLLACDPSEANIRLAARLARQCASDGVPLSGEYGCDDALERLGLSRVGLGVYKPARVCVEPFPLGMEDVTSLAPGQRYWRRSEPGQAPRCLAGRHGFKACMKMGTHTVYEQLGDFVLGEPRTWPACDGCVVRVLERSPRTVIVHGDWVRDVYREPVEAPPVEPTRETVVAFFEVEELGVYEGRGEVRGMPFAVRRKVLAITKVDRVSTWVYWQGAGVPSGYRRKGSCPLEHFKLWATRRIIPEEQPKSEGT